MAAVLGLLAVSGLQASGQQSPVMGGQGQGAPINVSPSSASQALDPSTQAWVDKINQNTVSIISGNPNGTYLAIAYDIAAVLDNGNSLRVLPIVGKGATQNVTDLLFLRGVDMGITQSNTLNYFRQTNELGDISSRIVYIAKLFNEELHLLVRPEIKRIEDLAGKPVNFSDKGSGTQFTAREIFDAVGVKVQEVNIGQGDAFEKMRSGAIMGTVLIAGKPSSAYAKLTKEDGFHLLPVPYAASLQDAYFPAVLTSEDYPNLIPQGEEIDTVAVGAVLAAYNWPENTDRYRRLENFVNAFFSKFDELQKAPRHPKWQEVNLGAALPRWRRFPPAQRWLDRVRTVAPAVSHENESALREEFERFLARQPGLKPVNNQDRERLFQEFLRWREEARN